jgi:pyrroloquinoline-quinone synthase
MSTSGTNSVVEAALVGRRLLDHPFYRRWDAGKVTMDELADYATQYRHFENFLPGFLGALVACLPEGPGRDLVAANLADELGDPLPHIELFERFAGALGAPESAPSPAMSHLLGAHDELIALGARHGLAGFLAYESQAAEVARTKAKGLRTHYGLGQDAVSFWSHHAEVDLRHAEWARDALDSLTPGPERFEASVRKAADAWWAFLDEREAARPLARSAAEAEVASRNFNSEMCRM